MDTARAAAENNAIDWRVAGTPVDYPAAVRFMEERVEAIRAGNAPETVWLLEHPPIYTAGTSAKDADLLAPDRFPVHRTGRGGQFTYHGPGQRVAYVMLDLKRRGGDIRAFVRALEDWVIACLARFDVAGERKADRIGIWVDRGGGRQDKIAAIGVRVRRWVSYHGLAINLDPDLSHFDGIVPCGITAGNYGVTSLADLGARITMAELDDAIKAAYAETMIL
jgi:lipoyl(octanoyl) transferase